MRVKGRVLKILLVVILSGLFCAAMLAVAPAGGEVKVSCGVKGWYFAEGYTGGDFDAWILIQNPNQTDAVAHLRFLTPNGEPITWDVPLAKETRYTVYLNTIPGLEKQEVATEVICEGDGVVAERAMYFNYKDAQGHDRAGGHASIGADALSGSWYLPEGYTGGDFDTYVLLMNPGTEDANDVRVKLLKPQDGRYYAFKTTVPAGRRRTIKLDDLVWREGQDNIIADAAVEPATGGGDGGEPPAEVKFNDSDVSTIIYSDKPVAAERSMYFDYYGKAGGSNSIGAACAAPEWYLPEGYTGGDFDTWVMAMNPSGDTVDITYTFYSSKPGFEPVSVTHAGVPPWSRDTIHVDEVPGLAGTDVSTKVAATKTVTPQVSVSEEGPADIVAERSVYFNYGNSSDGATSIGACRTMPNWFLAEGYTGGGFDTYVLVMNPYDFWQKITATFMTPGGKTIVKEFDVPPRCRLTLKVDDMDPALASTDVSTRIEAQPLQVAGVNAGCEQSGVVVERAMYFVYTDPGDGSKKAGGSCSIGYGS